MHRPLPFVTAPLAVVLLGCLAVTGGCASWQRPSSLEDGQVFAYRNWERQTPVVVLAIDGTPRTPGPITLAPGRHVVAYAPLIGGALGDGRETVLHVIPCTNYQLTTRPGDGSRDAWPLVVENTSATADCAGGNPFDTGRPGPAPNNESSRL